MNKVLLAALFLLLSVVVACGDDEPSSNGGSDMSADLGADLPEPDMEDDAQADLPLDMGGTTLCSPCEEDEECGEGALCLNLVADGERVCGQACDQEDEASCPADYFCATAGDSTQWSHGS